MNHTPTSPPTTPEPDDLGWDLDVLRDLAAAGMKLAQTFAREIQHAVEDAEIDPNASADPGRPFTRMARCVRQTVALRAKLLRHRSSTPTTGDMPDRASRAARAHHHKRKALVRGAIAEFIHTTADRGDEERLLRDMNERLDDAETEDGFDTRPIGHVVIEMCEALGVAVNLGIFGDNDLGIGECAEELSPEPPARPDTPEPTDRHPRASGQAAGPVRPGQRDPPGRNPDWPPKKVDPAPD